MLHEDHYAASLRDIRKRFATCDVGAVVKHNWRSFRRLLPQHILPSSLCSCLLLSQSELGCRLLSALERIHEVRMLDRARGIEVLARRRR